MYEEVNVDSVIGPSHHFGGLAVGNLASMHSKWIQSNPKHAALQGLHKIEELLKLGVTQLLLPPQYRPGTDEVSMMGFLPDTDDTFSEIGECSNELLSSIYSSSFMWMANAGHFSPSCDTTDGLIHFTPANLVSQFHRSFEPGVHQHQFLNLFSKTGKVHPPVDVRYSDEGAANSMRFCSEDYEKGVSVFVYGKKVQGVEAGTFPRRQTKEAFIQVAHAHGLDLDNVLFIEQNPMAIDQGVFHNDVCAVNHKNFLLCHEHAFLNQERTLDKLSLKIGTKTGAPLVVHVVRDDELPLSLCVRTYLFNSQIVIAQNNEWVLIAPIECKEDSRTFEYIQSTLLKHTPLSKCIFVDLKQSMRNGGGPACLRLRLLLSDKEYQFVPSRYKVSLRDISDLKSIISNAYPDKMSVALLGDPSVRHHIHTAYLAVLDYFSNREDR